MARKAAGRGGARKTARKSVARKSTARKVARKSSPRGARSDRSDYRNKQQVSKVEAAATPAAQKQGDCLSKLFIIMLPFIAVGIYLMVRRA